MRFLILIILLIGLNSYGQTDTVTIVSYNLLNFPNGRNDCSSNTVVPNRADTLRKILRYTKPDIFVACEIQTEAGADSILSRSLNVFGETNYLAATYDPLNTDDPLNNQMFYNSSKLTLYAQNVIQSSPRNIDHYVLYVNDPTLDQYFDTTFIEVYMCHLKAGSGTTEQADRAAQTQILMDYIATRPGDHNHFICGDLNVYRSSEVCYQNMTVGNGAFKDPINMPGNWTSNSSFAAIHTQSTRNSQNLDCGATGGLDDRFDQILVSQNVMSGTDSLKYLANSYKAIGNDGNHYNTSINAGSANTIYPDSIVRALYYMSDHLPVLLKAVVTYPTSNGLALFPSSTPVTCPLGNDGTATISPNDGMAPYSYLWDNNALNQTGSTATGLSAGSYCVLVTDALGETDDLCVFVPGPQPFSNTVFRQPDNGTCSGEAHILFSGGTAPYTFTWNDPMLQTGQSAYGLCAGAYSVTVIDANGCTTNINVTIDGPASIGNLDLEHINIAPNPTDKDVFIALNTVNRVEFCLITTDGKSIKLNAVQSAEGTYSIDLSDFPSGPYTIELSSQDFKVFKKLIKL